MVHGVEALRLVIPLEKREVHDPERGELLRIPETETVAHLDTENSQHCLGLPPSSAENQDEVSGHSSGSLGHCLYLLRSVELVH